MYMYLHLQILLPQLATFPARTALKLIVTAKLRYLRAEDNPKPGTHTKDQSQMVGQVSRCS